MWGLLDSRVEPRFGLGWSSSLCELCRNEPDVAQGLQVSTVKAFLDTRRGLLLAFFSFAVALSYLVQVRLLLMLELDEVRVGHLLQLREA